MKRRIAKLIAPRKFEFFEEEIPAPAENQILVRTRMVGLCHSDLPPYQGIGCTAMGKNGYEIFSADVPYPYALGHEPIGVVEAVGKNVKNFKEGDPISGMYPESFATHFLTTEDAMAPISADPARVCLAEPLMCVANIARVAQPEFGDTVAIIGCGFMGLLVLQALKAQNLGELVAIDLQDQRLEMAKKYGATRTVNPARENVEDVAYQVTGGSMFDVVVEITGSLKGLETAMDIVRLSDRIGPRGRGKILLPSVYAKEEKLSLKTGWNFMLRTPIMHVTHPRYALDILETMRRAVEMYDRGVLRADELITHRVPFDDIARGFDILENDKTYVKGVVTFE